MTTVNIEPAVRHQYTVARQDIKPGQVVATLMYPSGELVYLVVPRPIGSYPAPDGLTTDLVHLGTYGFRPWTTGFVSGSKFRVLQSRLTVEQ